MKKKRIVKSVFAWLSLLITVALMLVLCVEAVMPGEQSAAASGNVGDIIDDAFTELSPDDIMHTPPTSIRITGVPEKGISLSIGATLSLGAELLPADTSVEFRDITWTSSNTSVVTVASGKLTAHGAGKAHVTAETVTGLSDSVAVEVHAVTATALSISFSGGAREIELEEGAKAVLTAKFTPADSTDKTVVYASEQPEIATVDSRGVVTAVAQGEAVITATHPRAEGDLTDSVRVTVVEPTPKVFPTNLTIALPDSAGSFDKANSRYLVQANTASKFTATFAPADVTETALVWTSSDAAVLQVDKASGSFTARKRGDAVVTATSASDPQITASLKISVRNTALGASLSVDGADLSSDGTNSFSLSLEAGKQDISFLVSADVAEYFVRYESADKEIAEIFEDGTLATYKSSRDAAGGAIVLTVTVADNPDFDSEDGNLAETFTVRLTVAKQAYSTGFKDWAYRIRKLFGHYGAFLLLGGMAAITAILFDNGKKKRRALFATSLVVGGFTFACLTEFLQTDLFTVGRGPSFGDVIIDLSGYMPAALIVYGTFLVILLLIWVIKKLTKKKE